MAEFELVEDGATYGEGPDPFDVQQCADCEAGRIDGRTFDLEVDEGVASLSCREEGCSGLTLDPEMLQMGKIPVMLRQEKSGGTYEYPNDCDVWFVAEPVWVPPTAD